MGKRGGGKGKKSQRDKTGESDSRQIKAADANIPGAYDKDTAVFILMSRKWKDEGNRLFQMKDYESAMLSYEKAISLLPRSHVDVSYLRSSMAACYMQLGITEYPRAIHECNLALEVTPNYSKALLKRARCYEVLNRLDLAQRDVVTVLKREPNNLMAIEIAESVKQTMEKQGLLEIEIPVSMVPLPEEPPMPSKVQKGKSRKKKGHKVEDKKVDDRKVESEEIKANGEHEIGKAKAANVETKTEDANEEKKTKNGKSENRSKEKKSGKSKGANGEKKGGNKTETVNREKETRAGRCEDENGEKKTGKSEDVNEEKRTEDKLVVEEEKVSNTAGGEPSRVRMGNKEKKSGKSKDVNGEKKGGNKTEAVNREKETKAGRREDENGEKKTGKSEEVNEEKRTEDKLVVEEEKVSNGTGGEPSRPVKLVFGEDIRWGKIPLGCSIEKVREIVSDRFPGLEAVLVKYRDEEGDLITITSTEELRMAEVSTEYGSLKLYVVEVSPDQDPLFQKIRHCELKGHIDKKSTAGNRRVGKTKGGESESICISNWIVQFAQLFKNYVGFDIDAYLDLHKVGMKPCTDAMEETITSEEAQELFNSGADKFQEMAVLALFNWGNIHTSQARKRVNFSEDTPRESVIAQIKSAYDWAKMEYIKAGERYTDALRIKPNFYEAVLALGQQQFELAKLSWNYAIAIDVDLESWPSNEVIELYNKAEESMEKGLQMWEDAEEKGVKELSPTNKIEPLLQKMKTDNLLSQISEAEAAEQKSIRSQIYIVWGTMLYERSIMEFKLGLPEWQECLEIAIQKFELAGSSQTDIAVMIKSHCSNNTTLEGYGFNIDEIVPAMHEMYDAKNWQKRITSFRLEPLLRRRISKLHYALENV